MALLQPKLSLKVAQRQILTPGLMQMVSVLALNKLELKEMINAEIVENPVLEELEESVPMLDEVAGRDAERERPAEEIVADAQREKTDPFEEIDFGSYFQDYLDPGFRSPNNFEVSEKPSFENFLSQPSTLTDHLFWQLGSLNLSPEIRDAAEYVIGNLDEDGYLTASEDELLEGYLHEKTGPVAVASLSALPLNGNGPAHIPPQHLLERIPELPPSITNKEIGICQNGSGVHHEAKTLQQLALGDTSERPRRVLAEALRTVQNLDPIGVATRDLRQCLLVQIEARQRELRLAAARRERSEPANAPVEPDFSDPLQNGRVPDPGIVFETMTASNGSSSAPTASPAGDERLSVVECAANIVDKHLPLLLRRDLRELAKTLCKTVEDAQRALDFIRTLDPRPGQRYNRGDARLIEPDVAFVKRDDQYVVVMNEDDLPTLRLNQGYRRMLKQDGTEKDVKDYVKERYRSALQLIRNIEQRKNTILRTCESIVRRQGEFLERGVESLKPMMIKEVAEEIGVHPSTVSRAVSNKYVHTSQGVFELRFFFSEAVNGPEGAGTSLMLLKRKVKKLIEDEDARRPLTDDQLAQMLQSQGIDVTRRTVAKYREDMRIPSTHQRRVRD